MFFHKPTRKPHVTPLNLAHFSLTVLMPPCCSSIIAALHHKRPEITNLAPSSSSSSTRARVCSSCQSVRRPRYYRGNYFLYVKKSSWRSTSSEFRSGLRFHNYGIITFHTLLLLRSSTVLLIYLRGISKEDICYNVELQFHSTDSYSPFRRLVGRTRAEEEVQIRATYKQNPRHRLGFPSESGLPDV